MSATRAVVDLATHAQGAVQTEQMLREAASSLGVSFEALQSDLHRAIRQKRHPFQGGTSKPVQKADLSLHPVDVVELAMLLGTRGTPELAGFVRRWLPYHLIVDPVCRPVIHALAEEEDDLMASLDEEDEECKALAARVVTAPDKLTSVEEDMGVMKAAQDYILSIWLRYTERRRQELSHQMQTLQGAERQSVVEEFAQLLLDQGKMKLGWEKASLIIECHLHRFAEE